MKYQPLYEGFWSDPDFETSPPIARLIYIWLSSCAESNAIGYFRIDLESRAMKVLNCPPTMAKAGICWLVDNGKIAYDEQYKYVWVKGKLGRYKNRELYPHFKGLISEVQCLPHIPMSQEFVERYSDFLLSKEPQLEGGRIHYSTDDRTRLLSFLDKFLCHTYDIPMGHVAHRAGPIVTVTDTVLKEDPKEEEDPSQEPSQNDKAAEVIRHLNEVAGKNFRERGQANLEHVRARLNEGFTIEECKKVIDKQTTKWGKDPQMRDHLCPETLFRPSKFEKYLNGTDGGQYVRNRANGAANDRRAREIPEQLEL